MERFASNYLKWMIFKTLESKSESSRVDKTVKNLTAPKSFGSGSEESNWVISAKLLANPLYVATIHKPEFIQSPYFKTEQEARDWLMENYGVKPIN